MRPKKVLLCVDDDEQQLSVLKFLLETNGYRVLTATSGLQAIPLFKGRHVDLVLIDHLMPNMFGDELVLNLKKIAAHVPMVLLGDRKKIGSVIHGADALLDKGTCSSQELLERVRIMSARKRGPRKQMPATEAALGVA